MRFGIMLETGRPVDGVVEEAKSLAAAGFDTLWC